MSTSKFRKIFLFAFAIMLSSMSAFSQNATVIDSLFNILENTKEKDQAAVYNAISEAFLDSSLELCFEYANKAIENAGNTNKPNQEAIAYINIAKAYFAVQSDRECLDHYQKALVIKEKLKLKEDIPGIQNAIGLEYFYLRDVDSSLFFLNEALESAKKYKNKTETANSLGKIGFVMKKTGKLDSAIYFTEGALKIAKEIDDDILTARFLTNLGSIYVLPDDKVNDNTKAIEYYKECSEINEKLKNRRALGGNYYSIGLCNLNIGKYDDANMYFQKSLAIFDEIDFKQGIQQNYNGLANVFELWGQSQRADSYPQAYEYYQKALKVSSALKNKESEAEILNNIGNLFAKQLADFLEKEMGMDWEEVAHTYDFANSSSHFQDSSLIYYNRSLKIWEELKSQAGIAQTLNNLGTIMLILVNIMCQRIII